jgi:quinolinate synthase
MPNLTANNIDRSLNLIDEINRLKKEMNAVILAHFYQNEEIQDIADFIGDSLDLSRKSVETDADYIVFCGVHFMAEVAKILNPSKTVLLPDVDAGCSLEETCKPDAFKAFRAQNPDHIALTYINCSAEVKALSDIIITSTNAEKIIRQIPENQPILFAPDKYLGGYLIKKTGRDMLLWQGTCIVHEQFSEQEVVRLKIRHPKAYVIAHPECPENLLQHAGHVGSTSSLLKFTADHPNSEFIILTEPSIIHQMKKVSENSVFYDVKSMSEDGACVSCNTCPYMQLNTIEKIYLALKNKSPEIKMSDSLIKAAKLPLDKMLSMS